MERNSFASTAGWIIGGEGGGVGGAKGMLAPPLKLLGGLAPPCPPPLFLRLCSTKEISCN